MNKEVVSDDRLSRRDFLILSGISSAGLIAGCATNPVTGKKQLMFYSEDSEIAQDTKWAPHQFSADYGPVQERQLNEYVSEVGLNLASISHRPRMPYNFRVLNTPVVNGYTFPGGSVGIARGLMLEMKSEAELAGVLGHEIGHVCYRHTSSRMSWGTVAEISVALLAAYMEAEKKKYAWAAAGLGMIGANILLCKYSREDEREADDIGMEYIVKAGYNPQGMADLMQTLMNSYKEKPNALEVLFSTHPMSDERYNTAKKNIENKYAYALSNKDGKERYMDKTVNLRKLKKAIDKMQECGKELMAGAAGKAEAAIKESLRIAPDDYAGLLLMSKCQLAKKDFKEAEKYAVQASQVYPEEPQALAVTGLCMLQNREYEGAIKKFEEYEQKLPGNSVTVYYIGRSYDKMSNKAKAAQQYMRYLDVDPQGEFAQEVRSRLVEWGYLAAAVQ